MRSVIPSTIFSEIRGGLAHEDNFLAALDRTLPVYQRRCIDQFGLRQFFAKGQIGLGGKIIVVEFKPEPFAAVAVVADDRRQSLHRMALGRLHVIVGIEGNDASSIQTVR